MYHQFWAKHNFDQVLQPVPGRGDFKHLTKRQIDSLSVGEHLRYGASTLLVRNEYEVAYEVLRSYKEDKNQLVERDGGVVVTGQPGIGMRLMQATDSFC